MQKMYSQKRSKKQSISRITVVECFYGSNLYSNSFYDKVNTVNSFKLNQPLTFIGFQSPNYGLVIDPRNQFGFFSFSKIVPNKIYVSDSLSLNLNGFNFSMSVWDHNFFKKNKIVDLFIGIGINAGQLRLTSSSIDQKNPIFAPQALIYNNYVIKRISISFSSSYFYDVSKTGWKKTWFGKKDLIPVNSFNQSGLRICLGLGWVF